MIEQFGGLHLYDLKSGRLEALSISVSGDLEEVRERFVKVATRLTNASISPSGVRAVFEGRGEIITVPEEKGDARNLTNTPGVMERNPTWSPDGASVAYFSDESGEYALHIAPQDGRSAPRKIALGGSESSIYRSPRWSPDSRKIAFVDTHLSLWYVDLDSGKPVRVAKDRIYGLADLAPSWSPDSKWLAYASRLDNYMGAVQVYSLADGKATQVTDGMSDATDPVWDRSGKYLFFTASTDSGSSLQPDIQSMARTPTASIYLIVLDKDDPSPLVAAERRRSGARWEQERRREARGWCRPGEGAGRRRTHAGTAAPVVTIDFDNILQRVLALPMPPRQYTALQAGKAGTLLALEAPLTAPGTPGPGLTVHRFDLQQRRADTPLTAVRFFQLAFNGEKMLYSQGQGESLRWMIGTLRPLPPAGAGGPPAPAAGRRRREDTADRRSRSQDQPATGVAADVPRGVAHSA